MEYLKDTYIYKLLSAKKKLIAAVRRDFEDVDITHENYITLHFIYENPGISQAELAELNAKDKNVIVKTIDRLEKNGWVERVRSPHDRRAYTLQITKSGEKIIYKYWDRLVERQKEALSGLSEKEQQTLYKLLEKVIM